MTTAAAKTAAAKTKVVTLDQVRAIAAPEFTDTWHLNAHRAQIVETTATAA